MGEKAKRHRGRRKKKAGSVLSTIVLIIAIVVFAFSAYKLYGIFSEYKKGENEYESLQEIAITQTETEDVEEEVFLVDFEALSQINQDIVGWIRFVEPSQISYPLVKGVDNDKYLHTTFEGNSNSAGTIFLDMANNSDFNDKNTFIYGHNMKNGSMFGMLRKYRDRDFCLEHPYFYIYTPDGREITYQVFAADVVKDTSESYDKYYADDAEFAEYITYIRSLSLYTTEVEVSAGSRIVSLSTCTNASDDERLLIHAVKVSETVTEE